MCRIFVCCVAGCFNRTGSPGTPHFHVVPEKGERRQKWINFLGEDVRLSACSRVCSAHFTAEDYHGSGTLRRTAIPSIYPSSFETERSFKTKSQNQDQVSKPVSKPVTKPRTQSQNSKSAVNGDGCVEDGTDQNMSELIEGVKEELCRVCGNKDDSVKSIFENASGVPPVKLVKMYLPLKIKYDDELPYKICSKCSCMLHQWHEFYVTCVAADKVFRNMCLGKSGGDREAPVTGVTIEEENVEYPEKQTYYSSQYTCKYCYETFVDKCNLRVHYVSCQENLTLCDQCGKIMPRKQIVQHMSLYHGTKKLCEKCGKSFYPYYLHYHMLSKHSGTFTCELCCKVLKSMPSYKQHIIRHQTGELKTTFKTKPVRKGDKIVFVCPVCSLNFADKRSLVMHLNKPKLVKCPVCKVQLTNEKYLLCHSCKKWTCRYCSKSFYYNYSFRNHERIHTGEKPYKCDDCDLSFRTCSLRAIHRRTVHRDPALKCTHCSRQFSLASSLRRHMDVHEGVGYVCPLCDKQLKKPDALRKHIKLHEMDRI